MEENKKERSPLIRGGIYTLVVLIIGMLINAFIPIATSFVQAFINPNPSLQIIPIIWRQTVLPYSDNSFSIIIENTGQSEISNFFMYMSFNTRIVNGSHTGDVNLTQNSLAVLGGIEGYNSIDISATNIEPGQVECFYIQFSSANPIIYHLNKLNETPTIINFSRLDPYVSYDSNLFRLPKQSINARLENYTDFNVSKFTHCEYLTPVN